MNIGTVKWFNKNKRFGFITPEDNSGKDIFLHITALEAAGLNHVRDGQRLQYNLEEKNGRVSAIDIELLD